MDPTKDPRYIASMAEAKKLVAELALVLQRYPAQIACVALGDLTLRAHLVLSETRADAEFGIDALMADARQAIDRAFPNESPSLPS